MTTTTKSRKTTATEATEAPARKTRSRRQPTDAIRTRTGDDTCDTCGKESATLHFNEETGAAVCDRCTVGSKANALGHVRPAQYTTWETSKVDAETKAQRDAQAWAMKQEGKTYTAIAEALDTYPPMARTMALRGEKAAAAVAPAKRSRKRAA